MQTNILDIISQNNLKLILPLQLNRDTRLIYNCIECNSQVSKTCRNFVINHLCSTCIINNKPIPFEKSLLCLEPIVALLWHPTKNTKNPKDYRQKSMKKVWWKCKTLTQCGCIHEFQANICDMVKCKSSNSKGCPFCTNMGANKRFCIHNSLGYIFPDICVYWSIKNPKTFYEYLPHSEEEVLWNCNGCNYCGKLHEYSQKISSKTSKKQNGEIRGHNTNTGGCIICELSTQNICECQQLEIKYPQLYKECDIEKNKEENEFFDINIIPTGSNISLWWKCLINPEHKWKTKLYNRTTNYSGCPYCNHNTMSVIRTIPLHELIIELIRIHDNQYVYPNINEEYINSYSSITILHKICGKLHKVNVGHHKNSRVACQSCNKGRNHSKIAIKYLQFISTFNKINIRHAENGGEYRIKSTKYKADGYCEETNTIYEFHGTIYHGDRRVCPPCNFNYLGKNYGELYQKTLEREQQIRDLGYNLVVMWELDWKQINKSIRVLQRIFKSLHIGLTRQEINQIKIRRQSNEVVKNNNNPLEPVQIIKFRKLKKKIVKVEHA